jgi:hypothetical protein
MGIQEIIEVLKFPAGDVGIWVLSGHRRAQAQNKHQQYQ